MVRDDVDTLGTEALTPAGICTDEDGADGTGPTGDLVGRLREGAHDVALILTPYEQSPLPTARLLRRAGVRRIAATGADHLGGLPDGLLDAHHRRSPDRHEAQAALDAAAALGCCPRTGDDGRLRVLPSPDTATLTGNGPYVVVHPGAGTPSRTWDAARCAQTVALLADAGHRVVVTGGPHERDLTRRVSGDTAVDLGGRTSARTLAGVLRCADVLVAGATGPAHLAAAVGTPVVSLAPVAPAERRAPYGVPTVLLGDQGAGLDEADAAVTATAQDVVRAVHKLT
ncbi:hypothetical protein GCM10027072_48880 [Streptomyces bullii]